jgi:hypothetical protein
LFLHWVLKGFRRENLDCENRSAKTRTACAMTVANQLLRYKDPPEEPWTALRWSVRGKTWPTPSRNGKISDAVWEYKAAPRTVAILREYLQCDAHPVRA